ncbi:MULTISPECIES: class I SAM-dependent methyltransferase [Flavobacterium]|uniref:class I SAM-dependent methyltransferase n=1 Tax=Flavobacterium TaxID=237 RepID=UPI001FCB3045|nr:MULTISPECIES: class I SAM-dependent methyltransferase [Flavobacterium]UOK43756.1 class I SAM-dependent methyltransferase [Flavobacterium enshiense]
MVKNKIDALIRKFFLHKNEELPSFLLSKLYHQGSYLPFTTSSLKFRFLACLVNDIVVNNRKTVLEFGSGISTIIAARLMKMNNLDCTITTVDESAEWQGIIKKILKEENLLDYVKFVCAPTEPSGDLHQSYEYNSPIVFEAIANKKFDLVLVDGPSAWQKKNVMSRASNVKFIKDNLADNFTIFIDNSDRPGEVELTKRMAATLNLKPSRLDPTFLTFSKGPHFNFVV